MISISLIGEVSSSSMVPVRFSSAISRMRDHGDQEQGDGAGEAEQRADDLIVHVHGLLLAHHLRLEAEAHEIARGGEEAESEDQRRKTPSADRRWAKRNSS